jgi:hypothetical protein
MNYYISNNKSVQKALNNCQIAIIISLVASMISLMLLVGFILTIFNQPWNVIIPTSIPIGFLGGIFIAFRTSRLCFRHYLPKVENKLEFYERAIHYKIVSKFNADSDVEEFGIELTDITQNQFQELPTLFFKKEIELTNDHIIIQGKMISLDKLKGFRLKLIGKYYNEFTLNSYDLELECKNNRTFTHEIKLKERSQFENELYHYLKNQRLKESQ